MNDRLNFIPAPITRSRVLPLGRHFVLPKVVGVLCFLAPMWSILVSITNAPHLTSRLFFLRYIDVGANSRSSILSMSVCLYGTPVSSGNMMALSVLIIVRLQMGRPFTRRPSARFLYSGFLLYVSGLHHVYTQYIGFRAPFYFTIVLVLDFIFVPPIIPLSKIMYSIAPIGVPWGTALSLFTSFRFRRCVFRKACYHYVR